MGFSLNAMQRYAMAMGRSIVAGYSYKGMRTMQTHSLYCFKYVEPTLISHMFIHCCAGLGMYACYTDVLLFFLLI